MKSVGASSRGSRRKETFFSQLPIERLSPHKSHNLGSHFSMVWVMATEAAPEVNRKWSPEKGKNIQNAPSGLSAPTSENLPEQSKVERALGLWGGQRALGRGF